MGIVGSTKTDINNNNACSSCVEAGARSDENPNKTMVTIDRVGSVRHLRVI